jgi:serine O-acetyltransferase
MKLEKIISEIQANKVSHKLDFRLKTKTEAFTQLLFCTLFDTNVSVPDHIEKLKKSFDEIKDIAHKYYVFDCQNIWNDFLDGLPSVLRKLNSDAASIEQNDPASNSMDEVYMGYPGFFAIAVYRLSNLFFTLKMPLIPRLMSEYAHSLTGIDIHPGASIGTPFFIDHGTGVVIGETSIIKNNVKIYQGVTLGALQVSKDLKNVKRHPTVEDNVTIYAGATILGGETVIGKNCVVGGNVWITESIPENSIVYHQSEIKLKQKK